MNSLRDILARSDLRALLADRPSPEPAAAIEPDANPDALSHRVTPTWSVGECAICRRFLPRSSYLRCRGCRSLICKTGACANLHAITHQRPAPPPAPQGEAEGETPAPEPSEPA